MTVPAQQPALFDPPAACPACQASLPADCRYDQERADPPGRRPRGCLNRLDPATDPLPDGY